MAVRMVTSIPRDVAQAEDAGYELFTSSPDLMMVEVYRKATAIFENRIQQACFVESYCKARAARLIYLMEKAANSC